MYDTSSLSMAAVNSQHQQRQTVISTTTDAITALASQLMENLNERSTALANGANFDLALHDAEVMRTVSPTSCLGYLKADSIYQQQGRQQQAVALYEEGLSNTPASDPYYTNLQMGHADATNAANKRVDFISQLPLDLVTSEILPLVFHELKLDAGSRCPYLYVSRTWRDRILQGNNLSFDHRELLVDHPVHLHELHRFSEHVKTLSMEAGTTNQYEDSLSIFGKCKFPCLTNFSIRYYGYDADDVAAALKYVSPTLTHLSLSTEERQTPDIHMVSVLDLCPDLVSLGLTVWHMLDLREQYTKLTHLTMNIMGDTLSNDLMFNMLSHLPSLVFLDIFQVPDSPFLNNISAYCPHMKLLMCGGYHTFNHDNYHRHGHGLQKLSFGADDIDKLRDGDDLIQLLRDNHQSLDHFIVKGMINLDEQSLDTSLEFNRLKEIDVDTDDDDLGIPVISIICRSPHLHRVTICDYAATTNDDLYHALKGLRNLSMLAVRKLALGSTWFGNLLEHHIQLGSESPLKELKVDMDHYVLLLSWMHLIAGLENLHGLTIATHGNVDLSAYFSTIATITKGCSSLSYLELDFGRHSSPEGFITHMKHHPTLQHLQIHASSIADSDIVNLVLRTNLKHIILNAPLKDYLMELLRKHIPHVECRHS